MLNPNALSKAELVSRLNYRCKHRHDGLRHPECWRAANDTERIGFFDIEATSLNASFGYMLSYCIKRRDGEILKRAVTPGDIKSYRFDLTLCKQFLEDLGDFDRLVSYYGTGYDMPFIRTRCLFHKLDPPPAGSVFHTDLYYTVRNRLKLHRNRLEVACDLLGIPSKGHRLTPQVWQRAQAGDQKSIDYVLQHNIEDVESLEALWNRLYGQFRVTKTSL